jgi:hypothetical protein
MIISTLVCFSAPAAAVPAGCSQSPLSGYDGFADETYADQWEGASSYIVTRKSANVCRASDEMSTAWVMIGDPWTDCSNSNWSNYAQSGYTTIDDGSGGAAVLHNFAAYSDCRDGQFLWISSDAVPAGQKHAYRSLYNESCACIQMSIDGAVALETYFNPYASGEWSQPFEPQFMGEIKMLVTPMPGTVSAHASFSSMGAQKEYGDNLILMPCELSTVNEMSADWGLKASGCTAFDIWQK